MTTTAHAPSLLRPLRLRLAGAAAIVAVASLVASAAFAQAAAQDQPDAARGAKAMNERFYTFDAQAIGGDVQKGVIVISGGSKRPVFERLLRLKRSFAAEIVASRTDPALR